MARHSETTAKGAALSQGVGTAGEQVLVIAVQCTVREPIASRAVEPWRWKVWARVHVFALAGENKPDARVDTDSKVLATPWARGERERERGGGGMVCTTLPYKTVACQAPTVPHTRCDGAVSSVRMQ